MNTQAQNYVGRGSYATPGEPTATPNPQTGETPPVSPATPDNWQDALLIDLLSGKKNKEYLFHLLKLIEEFTTYPDPTTDISEMMGKWIMNPHVDLSEQRNRIHLRETVRHIAFLAELKEVFFCFDNTTNYVNLADQEEVSNG